MKHAGPTRREIGVRTAFNLLGPLTNPAGARRQVVGVGDAVAAPRLAEVLRLLGAERASSSTATAVDELPLDGSGVLYDVTPTGVERREVVAADLGLISAPTSDLAGGSPEDNAALVEAVLAGERGPRRDVVLLNAAAALLAAGRAKDLGQGIAAAASTIDSGHATGLLARLRAARTAAGIGARVRADARVTIATPPRAAAMGSGSVRQPRARGRNVVHEIAARRAADVAVELDGRTLRDLTRAAKTAPPPRDAVLRLAQPGLHLIAEVKRSSPSAGRIAGADEDPVARARAYQAGGASVISVLCEPHWFGGSVADLTAVRAAVSLPVLAKEFVVDPRQLPVLRSAGADLVLLLAVLHPAGRLAGLVDRALDLGSNPSSKPTTSVSSTGRWPRMPA